MERTSIPYRTLDPEVEAAIRADRKAGRRHPRAFDDADVVRREPKPHDEATLARPAFARDIEKILNVPAYNRYADKTQVFSFVENDDICRRGLHVQLVSRIARGIGSLLGLNCELIEAIALGHDVGHTPFGHAGERYLSQCYHARTGRFFNHNVHSVRVLDQLYRRNVSLQTLDGVLCHNGEFAQQVLRTGSTASFDELDALVEACTADEGAIGRLRPSTLEGCVVRVADMIAYVGKDRYDAIELGVVDSLDAFESDYLGRDNARIINNLTVDIVNESYGTDRIALSEAAFNDLKQAKRQNYERHLRARGHGGQRRQRGGAPCSRRLYARLLGRPSGCAATRARRFSSHHVRQPGRPLRHHNARGVPGRRAEPDRGGLPGVHDRPLLHVACTAHLFPESPLRTVHPRLLRRPGMSRKRKTEGGPWPPDGLGTAVSRVGSRCATLGASH